MSRPLNDLLYEALAKIPFGGELTPRDGTCSLCTQSRPVFSMTDIVSRSFTEWEHFQEPYFLCASCAWVLSDKELRLHSFVITDKNVTLDPCPHTLDDLDIEESGLVVPASKQKQLAYRAEISSIMTDYGLFTLTPSFLQLIQRLSKLRLAGLNEIALQQVLTPHLLPPKALMQNEVYENILSCAAHLSRTPELYTAAVLLSRFTFCSSTCPPRD